ncbi:DUF2442 domain-containing protein [Piscirickettsiaceae bacterium NZ-RLO2]|nr:DUF2442 domain-containing protein [Piscirickettsiaceae bacterium NZ-RLO2]
MINPLIHSVKSQDDFTLVVEFDNNETKTFDIKPYLDKGVFQELKDKTYFRKVKANDFYISWPNEQDLSHDTLYLEGH